MSVINNVLNGLDSKPPVFTPLQMDRTQSTPQQHSVSRAVYVLIIIGLLLAISYLVWFQSQLANIEDQGVPVARIEQGAGLTVNKIYNEPARINKAPLAVAENKSANSLPENSSEQESVTGLQINENPDYLELSLQLPQGAQSFLRQSSKNRTVFLITPVHKKIIIPDIRGNRWLKQIVLNETPGGTEVQFDTSQDVLVETHHKYRGEDYFWVIRLKKPMRYKSAVSTAEPPLPVAEKIPDHSVPAQAIRKTGAPPALEVIQKQPVKLQINPVKSGLSDMDRLNEAQSIMKSGDWKAAEEQLNQLLGSAVDLKARINLLSLFQRQKKTGQMKLLLSKSKRLYPDEASFKVIDARRLFDEQDLASLITRYQSESSSREILNLVAISFQRLEQHEKAIVYFQRSLTLDPRQSRSWISLAISQEQSSQFNNALESYQMAQRSGPVNTRLQEFIRSRIQQLSATAQ